MQDTPEHIKQLKLKIWLSKTHLEKLQQFITDNDALFKFWNEAKKQISINNNQADLSDNNLHQKR